MKQSIKLITILFLCYSSSMAQDLAGRRIVNGNLSFNYFNFNNSNTGYFNANLGLLYGKIKDDNTYLALGGVFGLSNSSNVNGQLQRYMNTQIQIGPSVGYGKFIPIASKFYYAPALNGDISGYFGNSGGVSASVNVTPLRFMYHFAENFMLTAELGSAGLNFQHIGSTTIFNLNSSISTSSGIGVFYTFKPKE